MATKVRSENLFPIVMMIVILMILLSTTGCAKPTGSGDKPQEDSFGRFWDDQLQQPHSELLNTRSSPRSYITAQTLRCMWTAAGDSSRDMEATRTHITPYLVDAFNRTIEHNQISSQEANHFFSQLYHETGGFMLLSELAPDRYFGDGSRSWRERLQEIRPDRNFCQNYPRAFASNSAHEFFNSPHIEFRAQCQVERGELRYSVNQHTVSRHTYGYQWRGRGLTQLTHCSNYVRYAYYLATGRELSAEKSGGRPIRHSFSYREDGRNEQFSFTTGGGDSPLTISNCSQGWVEGLVQHMRSRGIRNFDEERILRNPDRLSNYCEPYFADVAGWYWKFHVQNLFPLSTSTTRSRHCNCSQSARSEASEIFVAIPSRPRSLNTPGRCERRQVSGPRNTPSDHGCFQNEESIRGSARVALNQVARVTKAINGQHCHSLRRRFELHQSFARCFRS